jgi:hypothetical protein
MEVFLLNSDTTFKLGLHRDNILAFISTYLSVTLLINYTENDFEFEFFIFSVSIHFLFSGCLNFELTRFYCSI